MNEDVIRRPWTARSYLRKDFRMREVDAGSIHIKQGSELYMENRRPKAEWHQESEQPICKYLFFLEAPDKKVEGEKEKRKKGGK
jgi:hypothetical protein